MNKYLFILKILKGNLDQLTFESFPLFIIIKK